MDAVYMDAVVALTGSGGWPMTVFLTPDREPFLRRHVLPARAAPRVARLPRRCSWPSRTPTASGAEDVGRPGAGRCVDAIASVRRSGAVGRAAHERRCSSEAVARAAARLRRRARRLRARAQVPARIGPRAAPAAPRGERVAADGHDDARRHGRGRHVRPARRRLPPLLRRRRLARAALREDAVRQRAARLGVPPRVDRDRRRAVPARGRGDARLHGARAAAAGAAASRPRRTRTRTASRASPSPGRPRRAPRPSCCARSSTGGASSAASSTTRRARGCSRSASGGRSRSWTTR